MVSEAKLQIRIMPVTPLQQNCSILFDPATKHACLVDPGGDADRLMQALDQLGLGPAPDAPARDDVQ